MSINFLRQQVRTLQQQLNSTPSASRQWLEISLQLQVATAQLREAQVGVQRLTF
jgi:hypothetical protein